VFALARTLLLADAVTHDGLAQAMLASARSGGSFVSALVATGAVDGSRLAQHLERGDAPYMHQVAPVAALVESLPAGLCERLLALPVRRDPLTGTVDIAVVDARDPHPVEEIAYWLNAPVRMVHTSLGAMQAALQRLSAKPERGVRSLAPPIWHPELGTRPGYVDPAPATETLGHQPPSAAERPQTGPWAPESVPQTPRYGRAHLPSEPVDEPVDIIELGPPAIERSGVRGAERPAPLTVRGPFPETDTEPSAGPTVRGPYPDPSADAEREPADPPGAQAIRGADDRDAILDALVAGVRLVARRVGVFGLRRDGIVGWTCSPELAERGAFRSLRWPPSARTVVRAALTTRGVSLVLVPADAVHAALAALLGPPTPHEVALAGVLVEGKGVAVVLADDIDDALVATERLQTLAGLAGESLEALLRERRERRESDV
jgi:hypothetical protein